MSLIKPEKDLKNILLNVLMPGRYVGGEFGSIESYNKSNLNFGICFPDLYEIGMSNQAIKLLYRGLNNIEGISCERVFSPAQDFETKLKLNNIPLYTLENGIPLNELDILGFSIGYELSATNILTILETGQIPILNIDRSENDPVIIAGGPAITNPAPFGSFFDAVYLGEAEKDFYELMTSLSVAKKKGANRQFILETLSNSPFIWTDTKTTQVRRSIWPGFNSELTGLFPISSISTVQDNGIIEIMRGCPNSCRFCHAASFYRPYRQKNIDHIIEEVDFLVDKCGYNEITLSSLSSGDYKDLDILIQRLNLQHVSNNISFSLPSLRINSFTLPLLKELSRVRRSGLTFAIETPEEKWRKSINKEIDPEKIISILKEAKGMGWKLAKFYFMIGLPGTERSTEANKISSYIEEIQKKTGMKLNVNVGTFIPKPHTPFQWSAQLKEHEAYKDMRDLKNNFKRNSNVKLSYHSPIVSYVEGIISRGDKRVGDIILDAYKSGARLDAWEEHFDMSIWKKSIDKVNWNVEEEITKEKSLDEKFPWDGITLGITKPYLKREYIKALNYETTDVCDDPCTHNCGICNTNTVVEKNTNKEKLSNLPNIDIVEESSDLSFLYLLEFSKKGKAVYLSHLNILNVFSKTLRRSGVKIKYTQGYNPKPKIEFAHPISLGIESDVEVLSITLSSDISENELLTQMNNNLPKGIKVNRCKLL
ncbi:MAG: TIGR03936 family radical SAM-associated protein, partial [Spirochaetia bacterium]|nr:TIGR03936 family radical SAM-associated protein [Spirochaetia bacterium]